MTIRHDDPDIWAMSSRRHARTRRGRRAIWVVSICAVVLIAMAGTAAYAGYRYEQNRSERILPASPGFARDRRSFSRRRFSGARTRG